MWFGTSNGLNRFDGENIKVFKARRPPLERSNTNFVRGNLTEDQQGRIWYANETGIYYYDPQKEKVYKGHDFMAGDSGTIEYYSLIFLDDQKNLWLAYSGGLVRFSTVTYRLDEFRFPAEVLGKDFGGSPTYAGNSIFFFSRNRR
jgi:ligand-binding sensor domain-containing protein